VKRNIKLTIEYDGTNFNGWQIQRAGTRTIQGEIEKALHKIFNEKITLIGSGRTDSGVHALGQVANFLTHNTRLSTTEILNALNANLPEDISILKSEDVPQKFHAQYSAKRKTYRYCILNRKERCSIQRDFNTFIPYKLNLTAIQTEAKNLIGRKDFRAFTAANPAERNASIEKNTVRTIYKFQIQKKGAYLYIDIEANGFLYKMVRNIVGTLLEVGSAKLSKGSVKRILLQKDRSLAGSTAPAKGLCLIKVTY